MRVTRRCERRLREISAGVTYDSRRGRPYGPRAPSLRSVATRMGIPPFPPAKRVPSGFPPSLPSRGWPFIPGGVRHRSGLYSLATRLRCTVSPSGLRLPYPPTMPPLPPHSPHALLHHTHAPLRAPPSPTRDTHGRTVTAYRTSSPRRSTLCHPSAPNMEPPVGTRPSATTTRTPGREQSDTPPALTRPHAPHPRTVPQRRASRVQHHQRPSSALRTVEPTRALSSRRNTATRSSVPR
jgi:hypothetical protein